MQTSSWPFVVDNRLIPAYGSVAGPQASTEGRVLGPAHVPQHDMVKPNPAPTTPGFTKRGGREGKTHTQTTTGHLIRGLGLRNVGGHSFSFFWRRSRALLFGFSSHDKKSVNRIFF